MTIKQTPARIAADFGPFDELMDTYIRLTLSDTNGNLASRKIPFEVYPPIPKIDSINDNLISGRIDERLLDEPIRLYRFRGNAIERLETLEGDDLVMTSSSGLYDFSATQSAS